MLKVTLLAGAMTIAAPVLAQTTPTQAQSQPQAGSTGAIGADPAAATGTSADQTSAAPTADSAATPTDQTAQTTQAASGDQVAQIVDKEFPTYDKTGKGSLTKTEFGQWMVALKSASDPTAKAGTKETRAWVDAAFAQADADKSKSVSKAELTGFLSKAQS